MRSMNTAIRIASSGDQDLLPAEITVLLSTSQYAHPCWAAFYSSRTPLKLQDKATVVFKKCFLGYIINPLNYHNTWLDIYHTIAHRHTANFLVVLKDIMSAQAPWSAWLSISGTRFYRIYLLEKNIGYHQLRHYSFSFYPLFYSVSVFPFFLSCNGQSWSPWSPLEAWLCPFLKWE